MSKRYQIGFPEGVNCIASDNLPDWLPIVDMESYAITGVLVALAPSTFEARDIVNALNFKHETEQILKSFKN